MTIKPVRHRSFRRGLKTGRFRGLVTRGRKKAPFLGRNGARRGIEPELADFFNYSGHPLLSVFLMGRVKGNNPVRYLVYAYRSVILNPVVDNAKTAGAGIDILIGALE